MAYTQFLLFFCRELYAKNNEIVVWLLYRINSSFSLFCSLFVLSSHGSSFPTPNGPNICIFIFVRKSHHICCRVAVDKLQIYYYYIKLPQFHILAYKIGGGAALRACFFYSGWTASMPHGMYSNSVNLKTQTKPPNKLKCIKYMMVEKSHLPHEKL